MRLDVEVSNRFDLSRNKSAELIKKGIMVDGKKVSKPSFEVLESSVIKLPETPLHVSRAGEKLEGFLSSYHVDIEGVECLDIGSSTGGFVEVLLEHGAKKVVAVDVGSKQLHKSLRDNKKVELYENTDIREFACDKSFELITCDLSFISLQSVIESIDILGKKDIILLFKPQFEVGRECKRDRKGVVKDVQKIHKACEEFEHCAYEKKWELVVKKESVLKGKEGNLEIFYAFRKR